MIRISQLKLDLDDAIDYASELANLRRLVVSKCRISHTDLLLIRIAKKAVDARRKPNIKFIYTVDVEIVDEKQILNKGLKNISETPDLKYHDVPSGSQALDKPPVIVGFGPSGIFAALLLSRRGYDPIVLERGLDIDQRTKAWQSFIDGGAFHEHASVQYGEGGAGTFSDGKLTTMINDKRCYWILEEFVKAGAHPEILYLNKPHIGTDVLRKIIKNIREEIIANGGTIRFNAKVTDFIVKDHKLQGVVINNDELIRTDVCLLGIGHSARDTFKLLHQKALQIEPKAFAVGLRIEHKQAFINHAQYGDAYQHPSLKPADYKLSHHTQNGRTCYTFCMCPGGYVVNASSEAETVVTNGMSFSQRDGQNANAALLVNVKPDDFPSNHPLAGVDYQKAIETKAYVLSQKTYKAPAQRVSDFINGIESKEKGHIKPTYEPGVYLTDLNQLFPNYILEALKEGLQDFNQKISGFAADDAMLTGPETRSSSPIRMIRNEHHQANIFGLYPMGEGAGYAGGIMSSAVDGVKTAEKIIMLYKD